MQRHSNLWMKTSVLNAVKYTYKNLIKKDEEHGWRWVGPGANQQFCADISIFGRGAIERYKCSSWDRLCGLAGGRKSEGTLRGPNAKRRLDD